MIVEPCFDSGEILAVLFDPWIYERITEDGAPSKEEYVLPDGVTYVMDEDRRALMIYHWLSDSVIQCHIHVPRDNKDIAHRFCESALRWVWSNTSVIKIVAQIPEIYSDVTEFAKKHGFIIEGINTASYRKNGNIYSQFYLGLTRPEA